jgi:hypothetical protein
MRKNQPTALRHYTDTQVSSLITETATIYRIHEMEATDEVWDAIDAIYAPEDRPLGHDSRLTLAQTAAISDYIAEQYRTNRTRIDGK